MIDEHAAMEGAQQAVGKEQVEEVAIAFPIGTTQAQATGALLGDAASGAASAAASLSGVGSGSLGVSGGGIGMFLAQRKLEQSEPAASIVLALTATSLYLLGRKKIGPLASFKNLMVIHSIPRSEVQADVQPTGATRRLTITDHQDGTQYVYELKLLGSGINKLLGDLNQQSAH